MQAIVAGKRLRPVIRLFVSSTFVDLKHERDALQRHTFQRLETFCARRGFQFQAIDLRWGVPSEASLDHRTMRICFEELRRSQEISPEPNFLILLGNRYGWRPLPEEISEEEFRKLEQVIATLPETGRRHAKATLDAWYRRDDNSTPPVYILQSRLRDLEDGKNYGRDGEDRDTQDWLNAQGVLWSIISHAFPANDLSTRFGTTLDDYRRRVADDPAAPLPSNVRFQASATEQEIWRGAFAAPNAGEHVLAFIREIDNTAEFSDEAQGFVDADQKPLQELKAELAEHLGERNLVEFKQARLRRSSNDKGEPFVDVATEHLAEMCDRVHASLEAVIQRQIDAYWGEATAKSARDAEIERDEHQRFSLERAPAASFVGRDQERKRIAAYLQSDSRQPLVVHGQSGCGKTALLAKASQNAAKDDKPIVRFLGVTPHSSEVRSLLSSLCQELRQRNPRSDELPGDVRELTRELHEHFKAATAEQPLIVFLDALDQLADADHGRRLNWIPFGPLPEHVKVVVSCLSDRKGDDPAGEPFAAIQQRGLAEQNFVNLDALSPDEAHTLVFDRWLPEAQRQLNPEQQRRIQDRLNFAACRQPLYLKIIFEEARLWRSYDTVPQLGENVDSLLRALFTRLEDPANHGPTVACALGYIASARRGLTETEILEVLHKAREYEDSPFKKLLDSMARKHELPKSPPRIPIAIWSRLRFDLGFYLAEHAAPGGAVLNFYHRNLFSAVRERYLASEEQQRQAHGRLADYFHAQDYWLESLEEQQRRAKTLPPTPRPANVRKVDELPWQLLEVAKLSGKEDPQSKHWDAVADLFTDLNFLEAKAEAPALIFELVSDFAAVLDAMPAAHSRRRILTLLDEAIQRDVHFIGRHPTTLFQCLWNTCWWFDCPEAEEHFHPRDVQPLSFWRRFAQAIGRRFRKPPKPDNPTVGYLLSTRLVRWRRQKQATTPHFLWVRALRPPLIALGVGIHQRWLGHQSVIHEVAFSPDGRCLASCSYDETIRLWDTATGAELRTLTSLKSMLYAVRFSPNGRWLAAGSLNREIVIWDALTGHEYRRFRCQGSINGIAFSPDSQLLAIACDAAIELWDVTRHYQMKTFTGHRGKVFKVAFAPDGKVLASASSDGVVLTWDLQTGYVLRIFIGRKRWLVKLAVGADGRRQVLRRWVDHPGWVIDLAFAPDGQTLASASHDGFVRIWNVKRGREIRLLVGHITPARMIINMIFSKCQQIMDIQTNLLIIIRAGVIPKE